MGCPWNGFESAPPTYCERQLCGWIEQPANTWSNLAYVIAGIYILLRARKTRDTDVALFGACAVFIGLASGIYHASSAMFFERVDVFSMIVLGSLTVTFARRRWIGWESPSPLVVFLLLVVGATLFYFVNGVGMYAVLGLFVATLLLETLGPRPPPIRGMLVAVLLLGAGWCALWLDIMRIVCDPDDHLFQLHAVWHVAGALALLPLAHHFSRARGS